MTEDEMRLRMRAWSETLLHDASPLYPPVQAATEVGSVLRGPATEAALCAAEERLGIALPPSYRLMLSISDGAFADPSGVVTAASAPQRRFGSTSDLGFLPIAEVRPLQEALPEVLALFEDAAIERPLVADGAPVTDFRPLSERSLLITTVDVSSFSALVDVGGDQEWELWVFSRDEVQGFFSLESWLRSQTDFSDVETVMELIARARRGEPDATRKLGRLRDQRAMPILEAALSEFPENISVVVNALQALGNMRNDAAIPAIEPWVKSKWSRYAIDALVRIGTPAARDALARGDRHRELAAMGDTRAYDLAISALTSDPVGPAAMTLRDLGRPEAVPLLRDAWHKSSHPGAQLSIAAALKACGAPEAHELLQVLASDPAYRFRRQARAILEGKSEDG